MTSDGVSFSHSMSDYCICYVLVWRSANEARNYASSAECAVRRHEGVVHCVKLASVNQD